MSDHDKPNIALWLFVVVRFAQKPVLRMLVRGLDSKKRGMDIFSWVFGRGNPAFLIGLVISQMLGSNLSDDHRTGDTPTDTTGAFARSVKSGDRL